MVRAKKLKLYVFSNFASQGLDQKQIHAYRRSSPLNVLVHRNVFFEQQSFTKKK